MMFFGACDSVCKASVFGFRVRFRFEAVSQIFSDVCFVHVLL